VASARRSLRAGAPGRGHLLRDRGTGRVVALARKKKRQVWVWLAVDRASGCILGWQLGSRGQKTLKRLLAQLACFRIGSLATDSWKAYRLIDPKRRIQSKRETYTVEGVNSRFRHFFARFKRKTFCYTKSLEVLALSIPPFVDYLNTRLTT